MLNQLIIPRKEVGKIKVTLKIPISLSCEKITQTPRAFKTSQIKEAIENIAFEGLDKIELPDIVIQTIEFISKDFFLYLHQTGLYNRQFKLWKTLANITQVSIYKVQKGLFQKKDLEVYIIDFSIDPKFTSIRVIINNQETSSCFDELKKYLNWSLISNFGKLKGIFYLLKSTTSESFLLKLQDLTKTSDPISKYESVISNTGNIRLNVINFNKENEIYKFNHIYPDLKSVKKEMVT